MKKIQIEDVKELINKGYPKAYIEKILNDILIISLKVKDDYPDYRIWYQEKQVPGIYDNTRNIIIAHFNGKILGFVSLKKTKEEKKICTFYVEKSFRKNKIGTILVEKAIEYLEEERPLITIPLDKINDFIKIANKYNWEITDIKENLYRTTTPEVIVNGSLQELVAAKEDKKEFVKLYRYYKFMKFKAVLKNCLIIFCKNS